MVQWCWDVDGHSRNADIVNDHSMLHVGIAFILGSGTSTQHKHVAYAACFPLGLPSR